MRPVVAAVPLVEPSADPSPYESVGRPRLPSPTCLVVDPVELIEHLDVASEIEVALVGVQRGDVGAAVEDRFRGHES